MGKKVWVVVGVLFLLIMNLGFELQIVEAQWPVSDYPYNGGEGRGALFDPYWNTPYGWIGPLATWNGQPPPNNFGEGYWASPDMRSGLPMPNTARVFAWGFWSPGISPKDAIPGSNWKWWN